MSADNIPCLDCWRNTLYSIESKIYQSYHYHFWTLYILPPSPPGLKFEGYLYPSHVKDTFKLALHIERSITNCPFTFETMTLKLPFVYGVNYISWRTLVLFTYIIHCLLIQHHCATSEMRSNNQGYQASKEPRLIFLMRFWVLKSLSHDIVHGIKNCHP